MKNSKVVVLIECNDKKIRQVIIDKKKLNLLLEAITTNGKIRVYEKPLENIEIVKGENK